MTARSGPKHKVIDDVSASHSSSDVDWLENVAPRKKSRSPAPPSDGHSPVVTNAGFVLTLLVLLSALGTILMLIELFLSSAN